MVIWLYIRPGRLYNADSVMMPETAVTFLKERLPAPLAQQVDNALSNEGLAGGADKVIKGEQTVLINNNKRPEAPRGLSRLLYRAPIYLYRAGLGWLLGERFLLLNHVGRRSGRPRQAVLEVIDIDRENNTYFVASGFGRKSHWYQNIMAHPSVTIQVGPRRLMVTAVPLSPKTSGQALVDYAQRNPRAAKALMGLIGISSDGSDASYRAIGEELIPVVAFRRQQELAPVSRLPGWLLLVIGLGLVWWLTGRKNG